MSCSQDLDWEEEAEKDDRNEANKHFEYYMMALVEGPKVSLAPDSDGCYCNHMWYRRGVSA